MHGCYYFVLFWGVFKGVYSIFFVSPLTPRCVKCGINVLPCCSGEQMTEYEIDDVVSDKKIK